MIFIFAILIYLISNTIDLSNLFLEIIIKLIILSLFPIILYIFRFFEKKEINKIKEILKNRKSLKNQPK
jgi:hypothetical protein